MTGVMAKLRCGSYPLMNLAEDFGVDYGDVLLLFELALAVMRDQRGVLVLERLPAGRSITWVGAGERILGQLGEDRAEALGEAMRPLAEARAAI